ncbi:WG repeat-containing protein [Paraburkholderia adhaesiva]|uniref:WG repeat-containing protein n=1 Tax=Paraburkholderia adhaesiva TaxID=2883244 RepID=UPI001F342786|nr:WG repeat-containing protein [Paraburkholderia adhaesiva]
MNTPTVIRRYALPLLLAYGGFAYADTSPPEPVDAPAPLLIPVCAQTLYHACGLVDRHGNWVVEPAYGQLYASGKLWVVERESGLMGLLDANGKTIIQPSLQSIGLFSEGLAPAQRWGSDKYGYIDAKGQFVIAPDYTSAGGFSGGLAVVSTTVDDEMGVIDRQNHLVVPFGQYDHVDAYAYGLATVQRGGDWGVIDAHGRLVLPLRPRQNLVVIGPDRILAVTASSQQTGSNRYALLDGQGHELFAVAGQNAVIQTPTEGLSFFTDAQGRTGVLDIQAGRIVIAPHKDWSNSWPFSDGVAWVSLAGGTGDESVYVLIDHHGKDLLRRTGGGVTYFHNGVAAVSDKDDHWGLIDHSGRFVHTMTYSGSAPAWEWSEQTPRDGDALKFTQSNAQDSSDKTVWIDARGQTIASVEPQACGIEAVRNAKGDIVWPRNLGDTCTAKAQAEGSQAATSAGVQAVLLEAAQRKLQLAKEEDRRHGYEFGPSSSGDILVPLDTVWQHGPASIKLDGPATFELPKGYHYLSPEAVRRLPDPVSPGGGLSVALLAPEDGLWVGRLVVAQQGYVPSKGAQLDAQKLKEAINYYGTRFDIRASTGIEHNTSIE